MEESSKKKKCPFCGSEINADAKKCRFCNNWIDDEIKCPYCAETIKASAKKCRFCGEWLNKDEHQKNPDEKETNPVTKKSKKQLYKIFILSALGVVVLSALSFLIWRFFIFIPDCSDKAILTKLENNIQNKYRDIQVLHLYKDSVKELSKKDNGYVCRISAEADNAALAVEYNYKKSSVNNYEMDLKVLLPDCYDGTIKNILSTLILKSDYLEFNEKASSVNIEYAAVEKFDKDIPKYMCSADFSITAKPGQAFILDYWGDASDEIKCKVKYDSLFCGNGYTTCASLNTISNCSEKKD